MAFITAEKTSEELTAEMLAEIPETYQKTTGFFIWDVLRAISIIFVDIYSALAYVAGLDDLSNFDYDDLVRFVYQRRGIEAKEASYATATMTVTAGDGGTISAGDLFETESGIQFEAVEETEFTEGTEFEVQCVEAGDAGNVAAETIIVIPKTIQGLTSVINYDAATGGYDAETAESIIERYEEDLQNPIVSGNVYHYKKWAKEVTGVGDACVKPLWNGDNTVKVIIINSDYELADEDLIQEVQDYIDPYTLDDDGNKVGWGCGYGEAPIGAYCTVVTATAVTINVSFSLQLKSGVDEDDAKEEIETAILEYLHSIAFDDDIDYVSYAKIGACIIGCDSVYDYSDLLINDDTDNITLEDTDTDRELAVLGDITYTLVEA